MTLPAVKEIDIYGVFVPALLVWAPLSFLIVKVAHKNLARRGFYRSDTEQQVFDIALFLISASLLSFLVP